MSSSEVGASSPSTIWPARSISVTSAGASVASSTPVGVIATPSPARALTLPAVPRTRPAAARRRQAPATCSRSALEESSCIRGWILGRKFDSRRPELDARRACPYRVIALLHDAEPEIGQPLGLAGGDAPMLFV